MSLWLKSCGETIQMKAIEQYFPVVLFTMLYKVVLRFQSVDGIKSYDHSNEATKQYFPAVELTISDIFPTFYFRNLRS